MIPLSSLESAILNRPRFAPVAELAAPRPVEHRIDDEGRTFVREGGARGCWHLVDDAARAKTTPARTCCHANHNGADGFPLCRGAECRGWTVACGQGMVRCARHADTKRGKRKCVGCGIVDPAPAVVVVRDLSIDNGYIGSDGVGGCPAHWRASLRWLESIGAPAVVEVVTA